MTDTTALRQNTSVGTATGYGLNGRVSIPGGMRFFSTPQCPDRLWGSPSRLSNEYRGLFPGIKRPGREVDHSSQSSAKVKKGGALPPLPTTSSWRDS
jgi:hypothetical protein